MNVYASIVSGLLKLFNAIAQRLQQHHDELNGANAQKVATHDATDQVLKDVGAPIANAERDELWDQNRQKFGTNHGADR